MPRLLCRLGAGLLAAAAGTAGAAPVTRDHLRIELVAQHTALVPGESAWLGLRLQHDPHWHTYWVNPGDTGMATQVHWDLPAGYRGEAIAWPAPQRLRIGDLYNFGYSDSVLLPVQVQVPADAALGKRVPLRIAANWLICEEECIPGSATLELELPLARVAEADPRWRDAFATAQARRPQPVSWPSNLSVEGDTLQLRIADTAIAADAELDGFALQAQVLSNAPAQIVRDGAALTLRVARSEYFAQAPTALDLVLVAKGREDVRAWQIRTPWPPSAVAASTPGNATARGVSSGATVPAAGDAGLGMALLLALLGGLCLNLMPCVFPVLSLKALSLAEGAHAPARARRDGLAYLAGSVSGFVALAAALLLLRHAGEGLGWGFQLQSPPLVAGLAYLMIALGLSLSGMYVIGARLGGIGQHLAEGSSARAAFFTGVLACIVASPCTAPFMGPALGYALTQPAAAALAVFAALGVGLAAPILLLSLVPALTRWLPRPGAWMESLKLALAWPLYLTAVWLLWVLMRQVGADATAMVLAGALALIAALHSVGRGQGHRFSWGRRCVIAALLLLALAPLPGLRVDTTAPSDAVEGTAQAWTPARLQALRQAGQPVFVNMTAAWCITCLANERVALASDAFQRQLADGGITYLKGDWTRQDAAITAYLAQFQRNGVPLYVVYPRHNGEPIVLPQLLTPGLVADALRQATAASSPTAPNRSSP